MSDKTISSYIWVLNTLLATVNNLQPSTIYSDCDIGLNSTIKIILQSTWYLYCIFHIIQNIKKHLMWPLESQYAEFQSAFFSYCNTLFETTFELRFEALCTKFSDASSYLRTTLYLIKHQ